MKDEPQGMDGGMQGDEPEFEFDGRDTGEEDFLIREGKHQAVVIDFQKDVSQAGNDMYVWEFQIVSGSDKGETIRDWTSLLPQARWKVADYLEACGIGKAKGSIAKFTRGDIVDSPVIIEVEHTERDGQPQNNVVDIYEPSQETIEDVKEYVDGDVPDF